MTVKYEFGLNVTFEYDGVPGNTALIGTTVVTGAE